MHIKGFMASTTVSEMNLAFHIQWTEGAKAYLRKARAEKSPAVRAVFLEGARDYAKAARREWENFLRVKKMEKPA